MNSPDDLVIPGKPLESYLVVLGPDARRPMPQKILVLVILGEELKCIKEWIQNGAID